MDLDYEKDIEPLIARDKHLEVDSFVALPLKSKVIEGFINSNEFIPHGLYVLERVLLRENISVAKNVANASFRTR
ncbi:hypothetical protein [Halomonas sp. E19]|uniref:hypothetical protein n=1 Tax=Halomonas sp. E19 TaxID=3397247 RepID=UPI004033DB8E